MVSCAGMHSNDTGVCHIWSNMCRHYDTYMVKEKPVLGRVKIKP